jgi:hypothetical protein
MSRVGGGLTLKISSALLTFLRSPMRVFWTDLLITCLPFSCIVLLVSFTRLLYCPCCLLFSCVVLLLVFLLVSCYVLMFVLHACLLCCPAVALAFSTSVLSCFFFRLLYCPSVVLVSSPLLNFYLVWFALLLYWHFVDLLSDCCTFILVLYACLFYCPVIVL